METIYQEEDSTFSGNGVTYDLNKIWKAVHNDPILQVSVSHLKWILPHVDASDTVRIDNADLRAPLLLTRYYGKLLVVDGVHRLLKAVKKHVEYLPYRLVSDKVMKVSIITNVVATESIVPTWANW